MKNLFVLGLTALTVLVYSNISVYAFVDAGAVNSTAVEDMRIHEIMSRSENRNAILNFKKNETEQALTQDQSAVKNVSFVNNSAISSEELLSVVGKYINQPMTQENLSLIRKDIMKHYQDKGYFGAIAKVVSENTQTGNIVFSIKEGSKNSVVVKENF